MPVTQGVCPPVTCLNIIQLITFDKKRIAFRMAKTVYFKVNVKVGPFDSLRS